MHLNFKKTWKAILVASFALLLVIQSFSSLSADGELILPVDELNNEEVMKPEGEENTAGDLDKENELDKENSQVEQDNSEQMIELQEESMGRALVSNEILVTTFGELKTAIETVDDKTVIYLGADITFAAGGIQVKAGKNSFVIDGTNPETGVRYSINEYGSTTITNTIYVNTNTGGNSLIELRNMNIYGQNSYGTVAISDATANMSVKYSNVSYSGPRMIYNSAGTSIINGSDIRINRSGYFSPSQEVGQVNKVQFEGNVSIEHVNSGTKGIFLFRNSDRLSTIKEGANVFINTDRFYDNTSDNIAGFVMKPKSTFKMIANSGGYPIFKAKTFQMDDSEFDVVVNGTQSNYLFRIDGDANSGLTMKNNSKLNITTNASSSTVGAGVYQRGNWNVENSIINYKATNAVANYIFNMDNPVIKDSEFNIVADSSINVQATGSFLEAASLTLDNSSLNISANVNSGKLLTTTTGESLRLLNSPKINLYSKKLEGTLGMMNTSGALVIPTNGEFKAIVEKSEIGGVNSFLRIANKLQVEENASFEVAGNSGEHQALAVITGATPQLTINNPKLFVVFTKNARTGAFSISNPMTYTIKGQQINQWREAPVLFENSGGFNDIPVYEYKKASGVDYEIDGRLTTTGSTFVTSTNFTNGDGFYPGDYFDFGVGRTRILSVGRLDGEVNPISVGSTAISGTTTANANVNFTYKEKDSGIEAVANGVANGSGEYSIDISPIAEETYSLKFNSPYLYYNVTGMPERLAGELAFVSVPDAMPFGALPIQAQTKIFDRFHDAWDIVIKDDRVAHPSWKLFVTVTKGLTPADVSKPTVDDAFAYVSEDGLSNPLYLDTPQEVASSSSGTMETVSWSKNKGVLLKINPGSVFKDVEYSGTLQWTLVDAP